MKYLTIDDVCEMLSISRRTLERMRSPSSKIFRNTISCDNSFDIWSNKGVRVEQSQGRAFFPEPDFYIGNSPRWERDSLVVWLTENGHRL